LVLASSILFWRRQKSRFLVLASITQHVAGKDFVVFLPEHVLQHLPGQENAIILTGHVLRLRLEHGLGLFGARLRRDSFEIAVKGSTFAV
jgi:hypothetical protein